MNQSIVHAILGEYPLSEPSGFFEIAKGRRQGYMNAQRASLVSVSITCHQNSVPTRPGGIGSIWPNHQLPSGVTLTAGFTAIERDSLDFLKRGACRSHRPRRSDGALIAEEETQSSRHDVSANSRLNPSPKGEITTRFRIPARGIRLVTWRVLPRKSGSVLSPVR